MELVVCKHYQTGYCKFGVFCRKQHVTEMCLQEQCDKIKCDKRHPNICKYFSINQFCKFGEICSYKHITSKNISDTAGLEIKIGHLEDSLKSMAAQITHLETKIAALEKISTIKSGFHCDDCGYSASSQTVLKRHITTKHQSTNLQENLRDPDLDKSLQLSPGSEERAENSFSLEDEFSLQEGVKCEYWTCKFESKSKNELTQHIKVKHAVDDSFVYPNSSEEVECPECGKLFMADHNYARHAYEEHLYSFDCTHCHNHFPGDDLMYCIHMKMCLTPCDGNPRCSCKYLN